jgi:amino acid transporter
MAMIAGVRSDARDSLLKEGAPPVDAAAGEVARVEERSAAFKKELGLTDLVLQQIVYVVGIVWVGAAAKLGQSHIAFWLAAMVLFYLPQAAVVIHLSRAMPLEGGLYQWTKLGLGEAAGFMVAWNLWMYAVVLISSIGLLIATNLSYAFAVPWMATNKLFIVALSCLLMAMLIVLGIVGLGVSKWLHNVGSVALVVAFAALIALPFVQAARGVIPSYHPFAIAMPTLTLLSLNIFGKLAVGALSGFEYVAVLAGECRNPEKTIGRSTLISAPIIAVMFILGTSAVLAFSTPAQVDLIAPIPQAITRGLGSLGAATIVGPVVILMLTSRSMANSSIVFTGNTRMPMVAGWDRLLPAWFTRLNPRFRTPVNSILFVGAVSLAFALAGIAGVGEQEAFQLLDNAAGILYGLTYLVLFALPFVAARRHRASWPEAKWPLKLAAAAGLATTLLFVILSVFPIIDVPSWRIFATKISIVVIGLNVLGFLVYAAGGRRRNRSWRSAAELAP